MNTYQLYSAIELAQQQCAPVEVIRPLGYLLQTNLQHYSVVTISPDSEEMRNAKELASLGTGHTKFKAHW